MHGRHLILWAFWVAGIAGGTAALGAAGGTEFIYQGQLKAGGSPVNGFVDLSFGLHDAEIGGSQIGSTETVCHVEVVNGLLTAEVDFGKGVFDDTPRWLAVSVRTPSTSGGGGGGCAGVGFVPLDPRQKVSPAPQAWYAFAAPWGGLVDVPAGFADGIDDAGSLTLSFNESFAGGPEDAFTLTQTGTGRAMWIGVDNAASFWEALFVTNNGTGPALFASKSSPGSAGRFEISSASSTSTALFATTMGSGSAVNGSAMADGYGVTGQANGSGNAVQGISGGSGDAVYGNVLGGTGRAGHFVVNNGQNSEIAVEIETNGNSGSDALSVRHSGLGDCALFRVDNPASSGEGLEVESNGSAGSVALFARHTGLGNCAVFDVDNAGSSGEAVTASTTGSGTVIDARTTGSGRALLALRSSTSGTTPAAVVQSNSHSLGAYALHGRMADAQAGPLSAGVFGENAGDNPSALGVLGECDSGVGVRGSAETGIGVQGLSGGGAGVRGSSDASHGVWGSSSGGYGVYGTTNALRAIFGENLGTTGSRYGVVGRIINDESSAGVLGLSGASSGQAFGVSGVSSAPAGAAVFGQATDDEGAADGVFGQTFASPGCGVRGQNVNNSGPSCGVLGQATASDDGLGVVGLGGTDGVGVFGDGDSVGVQGAGATAVVGLGGFRGVYGSGFHGVVGETDDPGFGLGVFSIGDFDATGTKSFVIDHPFDPPNKFLRHFCHEGDEPQNVYNGVVTLNDDGVYSVTLPAYFASINKNPRYTLTPIGAPMPNLHVAVEIDAAASESMFTIAGGANRGKVSWEVKATRNDRRVQTYGFAVEGQKAADQRGKYYSPRLFGLSRDHGIAAGLARARSQDVKAVHAVRE